MCAVAIRPKLTAAPLGYAMYRVEGTADPYRRFVDELWGDDRSVSAQLKELVFLRTSIVNECHV